jgi:hypothetical protein
VSMKRREFLAAGIGVGLTVPRIALALDRWCHSISEDDQPVQVPRLVPKRAGRDGRRSGRLVDRAAESRVARAFAISSK